MTPQRTKGEESTFTRCTFKFKTRAVTSTEKNQKGAAWSFQTVQIIQSIGGLMGRAHRPGVKNQGRPPHAHRPYSVPFSAGCAEEIRMTYEQ